MEQKNEEVVMQLYALRAGLSKISEEADKIPVIEEKAENAFTAISDEATRGAEKYVFGDQYDDSYQNEAPHTAYAFVNCVSPAESISYVKSGRRKERSSLVAVAKEEEKRRGKCGDNTAAQEKRAKAVYAKWLGTGQAKNYYEEQCRHYKWENEGSKKTAVVWTVLTIVAAIATIVFSLLISVNVAFSAGAGLAGIATLVFAFIMFFYWRISKSENNRSVMLKNYVQSISGKYQAQAQTVSNELTTSLKAVKSTYEKLYSALEKEFSALLDSRDWKYVDLVIFYFETGRAESMKEALQLVEREVQTQRIVGAIEMASERVCRTIATAAAAISAQLSVIAERLGAVIKGQEMQNALLAKASATSESLMNDVQFIKRYSV